MDVGIFTMMHSTGPEEYIEDAATAFATPKPPAKKCIRALPDVEPSTLTPQESINIQLHARDCHLGHQSHLHQPDHHHHHH